MGLTLGEKGEPHSNAELPLVLAAVQRLERAIAPHRAPSTTVAVNRNAQFVAHTDKGSGAGQSTSLIVGLGDYQGGELVVEGEVKDIRYRPVEFNGWTQRHWTLPFTGQRFSIVWFTPRGLERQQALLLRGVSFPVVAASLPRPLPPSLSTGRPANGEGQGWSNPWESEEAAVRGGRLFAVEGQEEIRVLFGTFKLKGKEATDSVEAAVRCGYRGIDTASVYGNEEAVAEGVRRAGVPRAQLFLTSKLSPKQQGYEEALAALSESLQKLNTSYLDLYLIHWPGSAKTELQSAENAARRLASWRALEDALAAGIVRAIGVSNFQASHVQHLAQHARIRPALNQVELHPLYPQASLLALAPHLHIPIQAYAPLGSPAGCATLLALPPTIAIAARLKASPAQVLLAWALARSATIVVKSARPHRMRENLDAAQLQLEAQDLLLLDTVTDTVTGTDSGEGDGGRDAAAVAKVAATVTKFCWDPSTVA